MVRQVVVKSDKERLRQVEHWMDVADGAVKKLIAHVIDLQRRVGELERRNKNTSGK